MRVTKICEYLLKFEMRTVKYWFTNDWLNSLFTYTGYKHVIKLKVESTNFQREI